MNTVREYRNPLVVAAIGLVAALLLYALVVSPQTSKLSSLHTQETTLQTQTVSLQRQLTLLQSEKQKLSANCADLQKITTQIPSVKTPADLAAEQSSFYNQLTALNLQSGTTIPSFSWTGGTTTTTATSTASKSTPANVVPVPVTMTITGNYAQMSAFVAGLDSFPRLFAIQTFTLSFGATSGGSSSASPSSASSGGGSGSASESAPPLWTGGSSPYAGAGPYSLSLAGSIYYTSAANALAACTTAAAK